MSRQGSTDPSGCGADGSSKARTTWSSASESRSRRKMLGGQLLGADVALGRSRRRRQVRVGDVGLHDLLGLEDRGQALEPRVWDLDHPDVELHPAESTGLGMTPGQGVEDGGLTRSGKPDDRDLHSPRLSPIESIGVRPADR
jgi:hypothetical protein